MVKKHTFIVSEENYKFLQEIRPKIAIIAPTLDSIPSQNGNAIYDLVESLSKNSDFPILIISKYFKNSSKSQISNRIIYFDFERENSLFERIIGYRGRVKIWGVSNVYDKYYLENVFLFLNNTSVNVIMLQDNTSFFPALTDVWARRFKIIHHQHNNALLSMPSAKAKKYLNKISEVVFVSRNTMFEVKKRFEEFSHKFSVVYNGIELGNYPIEENSEREEIVDTVTHLLFVGRIVSDKGVKELIQSLLENDIGKIRLKIVGDLSTDFLVSSEYVDQIKNLLKESNGNIELCGSVRQSEIFKYYNWADFVVVPSTSREGLPKVIFESLVMGKPVIASDRGGIFEIIEHMQNGVLIEDPVSPESIRRALLLAIRNKTALKLMVNRSLVEYRNLLSVSVMSKHFDEILKKYI